MFSVHTCWPDEILRPENLQPITENLPAIVKELRNVQRNRTMQGVSFHTFTALRMCNMTQKPRSKNGNNNAGSSTGSDKSLGGLGTVQWINIRLSPEDVLELERSEATLEYLGARFVELAVSGLNISLKPVDGGRSFCATLIRPPHEGSSGSVGLSGFGGNVRDALLVLVYKFDVICGGEADTLSNFIAPVYDRFR